MKTSNNNFLYDFKILDEDQEDLGYRYQINLPSDARNSSARGSSSGHRHSTIDTHPRTHYSYTPPAVAANGPVRVSEPPSYPSRPYSAANYQEPVPRVNGPIGAGGTPARTFVTGSGGGSIGAEGTARALLDRSRTRRQSLPANTRRQPSVLERDEAQKISAIGGERAAFAKVTEESLASAKRDEPTSAPTKQKSTAGERGTGVEGTNKGATSGVTGAPRDPIGAASSGFSVERPYGKMLEILPPTLIAHSSPPKEPSALAGDMNQFSRSRIDYQSLPAYRRRQPSALERDEAEKIAALRGEEAAVAKVKAESLVSAKSETPSAATKPKSNGDERNADAGGTDKRAAGALVATTAPRDSIATSSVGLESKVAKVVDSIASKFPLSVRPPALARDINEYSKWSTLEEFGYEFKGIQLLSVFAFAFTFGFHFRHTKSCRISFSSSLPLSLSLSHSLSHSVTQSLTHSLTRSLTY